MTNKKQAYISGPYSGNDDIEIYCNIRNALDAAYHVSALGYFPIVPHVAVGHNCGWSKAMRICSEMINELNPDFDILVLIPGWEESRGACIEKEMASLRGIKTLRLFEVEDVGAA